MGKWVQRFGVHVVLAILVGLAITTWAYWGALGSSRATALAAWIAVIGVILNNLVSWWLDQTRAKREAAQRAQETQKERDLRFIDVRREEYRQCLEDVRALAEAPASELRPGRSQEAMELGRRQNLEALRWPQRIRLLALDIHLVADCDRFVTAARERRTARIKRYEANFRLAQDRKSTQIGMRIRNPAKRDQLEKSLKKAEENRAEADAKYRQAREAFVASVRKDLSLPTLDLESLPAFGDKEDRDTGSPQGDQFNRY